MCNNIERFMFIVVGILIIFLIYVNKDKIFNGFENNKTPTNGSELDENGFVKGEIKPSYWYNYFATDTRSKCFACDAASNLRHPSNCIDCEMKGGRPVDKLLNRVLTR